jgi:hypothetical protein
MLPGVQKNVKEWAFTLPSELPFWELKSKFLESDCKGQNLMDRNVQYIIGKLLELKMSEMVFHDPFGHLKNKLWPKERPKVKLAIWLPTIKSQELP